MGIQLLKYEHQGMYCKVKTKKEFDCVQMNLIFKRNSGLKADLRLKGCWIFMTKC